MFLVTINYFSYKILPLLIATIILGIQEEANATGIHPADNSNNAGTPAGPGSDSLPLRFGTGEFSPEPTTLAQQTFSYFDIELAQVLKSYEKYNWVASPSSIKTVLSLLIEGAGGTSLQQLLDSLRLPKNVTLALEQCRAFDRQLQSPSESATLKSLSRILINKDIHVTPNYKVIAADKYGVNIEKVDFNSPSAIVKKINNWVSDSTQGLIPQLLSEDALNSESSLVILNAIYFKGDWKIPFNPSATSPVCFYINKNECKNTDFMKTAGFFKHGFVAPLSAQIIELEYSDPRYSMVILLPTERDGLDLTIRNLPFNSLFPILENLQYSEVALSMPKFTIEYSMDLIPTLQKLRVVDIFTGKANLDEMLLANTKSKISGIIHKAKIIVNEKGTIAAAASAVYAETLMSRQTVNFKADHPFMFFVRDKNTGYLFEGVYVDPSPSSYPSAVLHPANTGEGVGVPDRFAGDFEGPDLLGQQAPSSPDRLGQQAPSSPDRLGGGFSSGSQHFSYPQPKPSHESEPAPTPTSKPPVIKNTVLNRRY